MVREILTRDAASDITCAISSEFHAGAGAPARMCGSDIIVAPVIHTAGDANPDGRSGKDGNAGEL